MNARAGSAPARSWTDWLLRDWSTKALALIITVLLFVLTRDDVTRSFSVPLRVIPDPERVLLTPVPEAIRVQVRGPWARINRLEPAEFAAATFDLRVAQPGPLEVDRGAIVMPRGVVLAGIDYDQVDLRFDPVIERDVPVLATITGEPAMDYEVAGVVTQPATVRIRGGRQPVLAVGHVATASRDIRGADRDVEFDAALVEPGNGITVVGTEGSSTVGPTVRVQVSLVPRTRRVAVVVPVIPAAALHGRAGVPVVVDAVVSGPAPVLRELSERGLWNPIVGAASPEGDGGTARIEMRFLDAVPPRMRTLLTAEPKELRVPLPPPASPPTPTIPAPPNPAGPGPAPPK